MRVAKRAARARAKALPEIKFEDQNLTSFAGLVVFQKLFAELGLPRRLRACFAGGAGRGRFYNPGTVLLCVVVHVLLGGRRLREMDSYRDDPLVLHALGLGRMPSVPTVSRVLGECGPGGLAAVGEMCSDLVTVRLAEERLARVTLDFDGSVLSTGRRAEGAAVGFNKVKKGARSYYPLFCTVAQTGQVLAFHHRSGNIHDSNGAAGFVERCVEEVRAALPGAALEVRMDSAFFSEEVVGLLGELGVEFTVSVPFERFTELKGKVEGRRVWQPTPGAGGRGTGHFEERWKPKSWAGRERFIFVRSRSRVQRKGPLQLDLFEPADGGYDFKVVVTNKTCRAGSAVRFHEGRGYQERVFGELKSQAAMGYVPAKRRAANEAFLACTVLAHNLVRELQMAAPGAQRRRGTASRTALWVFEELGTLRRTLVARAGRLTRPAGKLTLTLDPNRAVKEALARLLAA